MISSLDSFFCLDAAADFYVNLHILSIEIRKASNVEVGMTEVARVADTLYRLGFLRRLRFNIDMQVYEEFHSESDVTDMDWFEITPAGRVELDRLYIDPSANTAPS